MPISKTLLNDKQIALAKTWLASGCEPYGYNKRMLWFLQSWNGLPMKNAVKLTLTQVEQLNQLL